MRPRFAHAITILALIAQNRSNQLLLAGVLLAGVLLAVLPPEVDVPAAGALSDFFA